MVGEDDWLKAAEWLDDPRQNSRWRDARTAMARFDDDEYMGKTRDVSLGGVGININGGQAPSDSAVQICVVFGDRVLEMSGRVVYSVPAAWGCRVGVSCPELPPDVRSYLQKRYEAEALPAA